MSDTNPGKEDPHTNPKRKQGPPRLRFGLVLINFLADVIPTPTWPRNANGWPPWSRRSSCWPLGMLRVALVCKHPDEAVKFLQQSLELNPKTRPVPRPCRRQLRPVP